MDILKTLKDYFWPGGPEDLPDGELKFIPELRARVIRASGKIEELGVLSKRLVTTAFVNYLVDALVSGSTAMNVFRYHDCGTTGTAEGTADTALGGAWGGSRGTGTQTEGASANIYKSVATITFTNSNAIVEHGLFSATAAGILMDRSTFAAINVASDDSIEFTYQLTCSAGG